MNIKITNAESEKKFLKASPAIKESLTNAVLNYDELVKVGKSIPDSPIEVNTDTCMEAFGDMLETPIPDRILIYTVGKRSRKKPIFVTSNLEMFKWYLTEILGLSLKNVNANSCRYWVERNKYPSWLLFSNGICTNDLFEPDEYRKKYYDWCFTQNEISFTDINGTKYALLPMENRLGPDCKGIFVYADGFED